MDRVYNEDIVTIVTPVDVEVGEYVVIDNLKGVASTTEVAVRPDGKPSLVAIETTGVFATTVVLADATAVGTPLYFIESTKEVTIATDDGGGTDYIPMGYALNIKNVGETTLVNVRLV